MLMPKDVAQASECSSEATKRGSIPRRPSDDAQASPTQHLQQPRPEDSPDSTDFKRAFAPALAPDTTLKREPTGSTITDWSAVVEEDGRTYQGYMPGAYSLPNDGTEQERLDLQHQMFLILLHGKLAAAPVSAPEHVLDIGTGTGIWPLQFADEHPTSHILGTDLSMIQPTPKQSLQTRVQFILENSETADWFFDHPFDYIHIRCMAPCFRDIMTVIQKSFANMAPGGWIELVDSSYELQCLDRTTRGTALELWTQKLLIGAAKLGQDTIKAKYYKDYLQAAGFLEVKEQVLPCPIGPWTLDRHHKILGYYLMEALRLAVGGFRKFLTAAGLSSDEISDLTEGVLQDIQDPTIHGFMKIYVVYGRKAEVTELPPNR